MKEPNCIMEVRIRRVPDTQENYAMCFCDGCPTYNQCMSNKQEKLYCSRDISNCNLKRSGCICGECSVAAKYALSANYYCSIGEAKF